MGLTKAYDELTDNPTFSDGLQIELGEDITDGSGTKRIEIDDGFTEINDADGNRAYAAVGGGVNIFSQSTRPIQFIDEEGGYTAVQYDTDPSAGVLRTPNAGVRVEEQGIPSTGKGLELRYRPSLDDALIRPKNAGTDTLQPLRFEGSIYDFSRASANLRLATGQAIEDGSGTARVALNSNGTSLSDSNGVVKVSLFDDNALQLNAYSGDQVKIRDREGDYDAVTYFTSSTAPGTLELTNANLKFGDAGFVNATVWPVGDGSNDTTEPRIWVDKSPDPREIDAQDGAGNITTLT
jgi:hypothetical protein